MNLTRRIGRCVCGMKVALHFDATNRKLSCEQTQRQYPTAATLRRVNLRRMFVRLVPKEI